MSLYQKSPSLEPADGITKRLVLIFHGYGADGNNLIGLGSAWQGLLPQTAFVAPHGIEPYADFSLGRQWFSLRARDLEGILTGLLKTLDAITQMIEEYATHYNIPLKEVALVGFSQGAMVALSQAIYGIDACAGVVSYAGVFRHHPNQEPKNLPPILLIHGTEDQVIPKEALQIAKDALTDLGASPLSILEPDIDHTISPKGIEAGGRFLQTIFNLSKE